MDKFEIRPAGETDRERIISLMSRVYPDDMAARYEWLYRDNPHGRALTWLAIERESGESVACTSIFPRLVTVAGRMRVGGIGGDCIVEPRVRRQGLATALHHASFEQMRARGVDFMYGPPTANNLGALIKAGSHLVTNYKRWVRPLTSRGAYRAAFSRVPTRGQAQLAEIPIRMFDRLTRSDSKGFTLEQVHDFSDEFDVMFERAATGLVIACRRDRDYLAWRYLAAPAGKQVPFALRRGGELLGFVAIERAGELAALADLFSAPDLGVIDAALQLAVERTAQAGCWSLEISLAADSAAAGRLLRHGFIGREERGFQVAVPDDDPQAAVLRRGESWHFTEADQDLDRVFVRPLAE